MNDLPAVVLVALLVAVMFGANEWGFRLGAKDRRQSDEARTVSNALKASVFGMVAFLLGFSFSIATSRHDVRRQVVIEEANALGTLALRASLLDPANGQAIRKAVQTYVDRRLDLFAHAADADANALVPIKHDMARLLDDIWKAVEASARANPQVTLMSQIVPAANAVIDNDATRAWAASSHLPVSVVVLLMLAVGVSSLLAGHSSGQVGHRHVGLWTAFNVLFAMTLFVVLDFDTPRRGLVQVDHEPLVKLGKSLAAEASLPAGE